MERNPIRVIIMTGLLAVAGVSCRQSPAPDDASNIVACPAAEYATATEILMYTPGVELYDGIIHPAAGLYEDYFDIDKAIAEHEGYISMLEANGIKVHRVADVLSHMPGEELRRLASDALSYDGSAISATAEELEAYRQEVLGKMSPSDLVRTIFNRPTVILKETGINTGLSAEYRHEPLMNMYFTRDQSITTPKGHILCRMNSSQRFPEVDIIEACYRQMGQPAVYRIKGPDSYLEGGDYIPFGTVGLLGQGLRTTQEAIEELLENDVVGHDTLVVVRDRWKDQYQMHLDTYFNVIDKDLCTMCFNRYDAPDSSDVNFLTIDMYAREPGEKDYHTVPERSGYSFKQFLTDRGVKIIRISKQDADHYANNFLTVGARHIMAVAGFSSELAAEFRDAGVTVESVPLDNLTGGYGAAHCMTQVCFRR